MFDAGPLVMDFVPTRETELLFALLTLKLGQFSRFNFHAQIVASMFDVVACSTNNWRFSLSQRNVS